ncbi:MAG: XRE family transcriptional regulator [Candidatus Tokpelaia hoelldobleri]|uniref:XRE family transcriptional regulator n=1 Tax=Candidatus Tokpelaia hoelldobleri TaxID=1902579 RepID=A0A1U9JST1_9HYPH|nr:MAG: XRE family transcriptional regulator [Candidatus Tokpelaia hoelldoblerii]
MTPFGQKIRDLRAGRNISQKEMAAALAVSPAYLSALEHGHRSAPSFDFVQRVITYFNIIWDEADELLQLAGVSHPRIVIDTTGLGPQATLFANELARTIRHLDEEALAQMTVTMQQAKLKNRHE